MESRELKWTGADLRFSGSEPVTSGFGRRSALLDAEEVRGSNPLAPTSKATMNDTGRSGAFEGPSLACQAEVPPARGPVRSRIPLEEGP